MNIKPTTSYTVSMQGRPNRPVKNSSIKNFTQKLFDKLPNKTLKEDSSFINKLKKYNNFMAKPAENRLIVGITALIIQPLIDYYNHRVDEETRTVSRNRTIAKIVACTSVGIFVRGLVYKITDKMTDINSTQRYSKALIPKQYFDELAKNPEMMKNYKSALSTICALCVMFFTNFLLDAPLTAYFTNKLNSVTDKSNKLNSENIKEGNDE